MNFKGDFLRGGARDGLRNGTEVSVFVERFLRKVSNFGRIIKTDTILGVLRRK